MPNISPGVYTKIIDLSTYLQAIPSTIAFIAALTNKGEDNKLRFVSSRSEFISEWGEPNITEFGKNYGQGPYCAYNYLGESSALYFMRCMPDDAAYSNIRIDSKLADADSTATIHISYASTLNDKGEIKTELALHDTDRNPICILYPIGRGVYYNGLSVALTTHSNPTLSGVYVLDIYERQSDGDDQIIESFEISFDPTAVDLSGDSIWIEYVLETYSSILRADMTLASGEYAPGFNQSIRVYDKDIGDVSVDKTAATAYIKDNKQDFSDWDTDPATGNANYMVIAKDGKGNEIYGWMGACVDVDKDSIVIYDGRDLDTAIRGWSGSVSDFRTTDTITYEIKKSNPDISSGFTVDNAICPMKKGSDGELRDTSGDVDKTVAKELLAKGYNGTLIKTDGSGDIEDSVLDTENIYFSLVFDCGYVSDVKTAVSGLATTRRDCVAIIDNGDNSSYANSITAREDTNTFNNFYTAIYEEYNKVYDSFTGQDVWFSPIYHMSYLLPRNDEVAELWYAAAGFNRGVIESAKELRFNPKLGQRDQMYLKQLNPIVKFSNGYTMWGQLTSQSKASALQDLNIVRLVLYCKRAISRYCRNFVFEQNDSITWNEVSGDIIEFLDDVKRKRGLYSYNVNVYANEYMKKTKVFTCDVTLNPTRVCERIELNFFIK